MEQQTDFPLNSAFSINSDTSLGPLSLRVNSLDSQVAFFQDALGFQVRKQNGNRLELGTSSQTLLELVENPTASRHRRVTGLYHMALLYPNRRELARAIARLYSLGIPNYPTDHIMTKTTYLDDQEGNGVELYCESPEDGYWTLKDGQYITRRKDGSLSSGREPLDVEALFQQLEEDDRLDIPLQDAVKIGHVHLHVRDLEEALDFYHGILGFDHMGADFSIGMGFVSAGGYHHHIGLNTWQGKGAPAPPDGSLGLRHFTVELPDQASLKDILSRTAAAGISPQECEDGFLVHDPSQNGILLKAGS